MAIRICVDLYRILLKSSFFQARVLTCSITSHVEVIPLCSVIVPALFQCFLRSTYKLNKQ